MVRARDEEKGGRAVGGKSRGMRFPFIFKTDASQAAYARALEGTKRGR